MRVLPTVGFPVFQFNPIQHSLMASGIVPIVAIHLSGKRSVGAAKTQGNQSGHYKQFHKDTTAISSGRFQVRCPVNFLLQAYLFQHGLRARHFEVTERGMLWPDAIGLGLFSASGTTIALEMQMPAIVAVLIGRYHGRVWRRAPRHCLQRNTQSVQ